ncbi:MAG: hypothetical protein EBW37_11325 [Rhodobacteraceae bacterium]|nr:hypothetical protein [Paracoccaceae bacterium]
MPVANVVMFEFETSADLENWAEWYKRDGPFPNNEISLFVKTSYPTEGDRESGGKLRDALVNGDVPFKIKEIIPFGGPVLVEFIDGVLSPKHVK